MRKWRNEWPGIGSVGMKASSETHSAKRAVDFLFCALLAFFLVKVRSRNWMEASTQLGSTLPRNTPSEIDNISRNQFHRQRPWKKSTWKPEHPNFRLLVGSWGVVTMLLQACTTPFKDSAAVNCQWHLTCKISPILRRFNRCTGSSPHLGYEHVFFVYTRCRCNSIRSLRFPGARQICISNFQISPLTHRPPYNKITAAIHSWYCFLVIQ